MSTVIHWFRRDLRVTDNTALLAAYKAGDVVVPVFVLEDALKTGPDVGAGRLAFLLRSVDSLRKNLQLLGHTLIIRSGKSESVLPQLVKETGATAVFCNKRYET
ncbi:MAG TPA: deoxyribodipyrimidine photo-lyase, partial [Roseimicrobium sp.]|nr:deoxyribodipyrimidine photo-lyase [Roseimicrobium sp.]